MTNPMTESGYVRKLTELERRLEHQKMRNASRGRWLEDLALGLAIGLVTTRSIVELIQEMGLVGHVDAGFPWGFWATCGLLVLPKVVGRRSAGRFWETIGGGLATRIGGGASIPNARKDDER